MRKLQFFIFFSIAILILGLINFYLSLRGWEAVASVPALKSYYPPLILFLSLSYVVGRILERVSLNWLSSALVWIGSFWLAAMTYFILTLLALDFLRLINHFVHFFPPFITQDYERAKLITALIVTGGVTLTIILGYVNARNPRIKTLNIDIPKNSHPTKSLNVVVASDIHLGTIVCKARLEHIVEKINALNPDLVLLPGDVVDEDLGPVIKQNLGETLRKIRSKFGVISITGNHEYIGGVEEAYQYLIAHDIMVLRDSVIKINNSLYVVGREDLSVKQFTGKRRKPLDEIMAGVDKTLPVILMDHQPFRLEDAVQNGVDLQLSGHTHHGQIWPFNFITKKVYEVSWGYKKKGDTHIYVSCGVGTWGPPVRIGNTPEIVNIRLTFS
ncbi:MAG: metallophosphoesterase [Ignavibacteriales bacterium]|nr:metallophosphoesterase [Ignavibacteriales bacterium]